MLLDKNELFKQEEPHSYYVCPNFAISYRPLWLWKDGTL